MIIEAEDTPNCATTDPEIFFPKHPPDRQTLDNTAAAIAICKTCPVFDACEVYALHNAVEGIWAGTTFKERQLKRKELGIVIDRNLTNLCRRGHVVLGHNAYWNKQGFKKCRACNRLDKKKASENGS